MFKKFIFTFLILISASKAFAVGNTCDPKKIFSITNLKNIGSHLLKNPSVVKKVNAINLKANQILKTKDNEYTKIIFEKPYHLEFDIFPNTSIEVSSLANLNCGPQFKLNYGKILSVGKHELFKNKKNKNCDYELETEEAYINPVGTTYIAETGALSDALAELNGESPGNPDGGFTQEKFSVEKGSIQVRLKKISKNKIKNKIKFAKKDKNEDNFSNLRISKKRKTTEKYLAYNEKIKLKAGSSLKIKRNKALKKTQTADLEVLDPWSN